MMASIWHGKRWTAQEIDAIAKEAVRKKYEADAAMSAAAEIEVEYWTRELIERFPVLESDYDENTFDVYVTGDWRTDKDFLCEVTWSDTVETCIISAPEHPSRGGTVNYPHARVKVWWQRAKKSKNSEFLKEYNTMRCSEIIPFITKLEPLVSKKARKEELLKGPPKPAKQPEE
jgi:hypothetical protein